MLAEGAILNALEVGKVDPKRGIIIRPMAPGAVGTNSVDLHLWERIIPVTVCPPGSRP